MNIRAVLLSLFVTTLTATAEITASPATSIGDLGENMARTALDSPTRSIVEVKHGRHGLDFLYYEQVDGRDVLHVSEVKAGGSQQAQRLSLSDDELKLLQRHGIKPTPLDGNHYQITQGSHGYNLVQVNRAMQQQARVDRILDTIKSGGKIAKKDIASIATHFKGLNPSLSPAETRLLHQCAKNGDITQFQKLLPQLESVNQHTKQQLQRVERDITRQRYINQIVRVQSENGRFQIEAANLDASGKINGTPREIRNVNWRYLRESGPFRSLVKAEVTNLCEGQRLCIDRAYKVAKLELETSGNMHQAMQRTIEQVQLPLNSPQTPKTSPVKINTKPQAVARITSSNIQRTTSTTVPAQFKPSARSVSPELRKQPLMGRIRRFISSKFAPLAGRTVGTTALARTTLATAAATATAAVLPIATAVVGAIAIDSYLDDKIDTHIQGLKTHLGQEFDGVHQDIAQLGAIQGQHLQIIQQDLTVLGEQVEYQSALMLEALDRHSQELTAHFGDLSTQMDSGFANLSQALLTIELKQGYGLALQEAQFEDALQAGLKHYDVYLGTQAPESLIAAEEEFTRAQARYENLLTKDLDNQERVRAYSMQHALASYYRAIVYAERGATEPKFTAQAVQTFIDFTEQLQETDHLNAVLPILNYAYISIADVDYDGVAGERLTEVYTQLIDDDLAQNRFNKAVATAAMLTMVRHDDQSQLIEEMVRYIAGANQEPPEELLDLEGDWLDYVQQRQHPQRGTAFALLHCAESLEQREVMPDNCSLSVQDLIAAAETYDNETIHRYIVTALLEQNRIVEAKKILENYYISDANFRIGKQLAVAYFQRDNRDSGERYCRIARHVIDDDTFSDDLRQRVQEHFNQWGGFCQKPI